MKKKAAQIKRMVRNGYARAVTRNNSCCSGNTCCGQTNRAKDVSREIGYSAAQINAVPRDANLGFGCGNPVALAALKKGDVVLDLGCGAGFDAFLATRKVGRNGRVIGVDMTPAMVAKARENAKKGGYANVEFRLGEIENLPLEDNSVDVIISNCVINLSPEKQKVFKEACRVLKPGGRLMISDLVLVEDLPAEVKKSVEAYVGCVAGAVRKKEYLRFIARAGFQDIKVVSESSYPAGVGLDEVKSAKDAIVSIMVLARKS